MKYNAKLIGYTKPVSIPAETPEELIAYCARRSSGKPREEWHEDYDGLLRYCIRNKHWSVFDMVDAVIELDGPRDILRQVLRHQSCKFQEFSQRYSDDIQFTTREVRRQDEKNRQNSIDDMSDEDKERFRWDCELIAKMAQNLYDKWRAKDAAKECCRVFLPEGLTMSNMAIKGSVRSWLHYVDVRDDEGVTQWEHVLIARAINKEIAPMFPAVFGGLT
jgi:thymidylate synthase (FAD)